MTEADASLHQPGSWTLPGVETATLSLIGDPVWIYAFDRHRIVWANDAALSFWLADSLDDLQNRDYSPLSDIARARLADYADRFALGEVIEATWTFHPLETVRSGRCRCRGVSLDGGPLAMLVHVLDYEPDREVPPDPLQLIEQLRQARDDLAQAEARYRTFAEAGSDFLWETDAEHRFIYLSASVSTLFGYAPGDLLGLTPFDLVQRSGVDIDSPQSRSELARHRAIVDGQLPFRDFRTVMFRTDGEISHVAVSGTPTFDDEGRFLGYRGVGRDLTETVRLEQRERLLERERDAAVAATQVMNQFLATMSHELRTPLNAIIGFSEVMSVEMFGPLGDDKYRDYAGDIVASARHLLSVVEYLLDLSRLELQHDDVDPEPIRAETLAAETVRMVHMLAEQRGLEITLDLPEPGLELLADRRGTRQILLNLLSNAIKFTEPGGRVTLRIGRDGENMVRIEVQDTGRGISPDRLAGIFEPFRSRDALIKEAGTGTGLGLWISSRMALAQGGRLSMESEPGVGTLAVLHLPGRSNVARFPPKQA